MRLPEELQTAIQNEIEHMDRNALMRASAQMSQQYRSVDFSAPVFKSEAHRTAYLLTRMPATYAAVRRVFAEVRRLAPQAVVGSVLDLGAGPGTALFAATEIFSSLHEATLMESDPAWLKLGTRLAAQCSQAVLRQTRWVQHDLRADFDCPTHDMVVISYALGELQPAAAASLLRRAWSCTAQFLVLVEPGTMHGFANVHAARSLLIADEAGILAPCPHRNSCPMFGTADWCHFAERIERTSQHRRLKGGALGYEDEKFSYVVASRKCLSSPGARIVRHPRKLTGHVQLVLCSTNGTVKRTVTRSQRDLYKSARQKEWGDVWDE